MALAGWIRSTIAHTTTGGGGPQPSYSKPAGDPGLFGPDAVCWRVHGDAVSMFVGGFAALMLQALEPRTLAGVFDHSNFRGDPYGRLRRTSTFVMGTTYAPTADAEALIRRVLAMHRPVRGKAPDGRPYSALDGELLTWVHVCEMYAYLRAYRRYVAAVSEADQDRYYDEVARVAGKLGGTGVPRSRAEVAAYFGRMQPLLVCDERVQGIYDFLRTAPPPSAAGKPVARALFHASAQLLPRWARELSGMQRFHWLRSLTVRPAFQVLQPVVRRALGATGIEARSRARMGA